jgi:hypothetical protein
MKAYNSDTAIQSATLTGKESNDAYAKVDYSTLNRAFMFQCDEARYALIGATPPAGYLDHCSNQLVSIRTTVPIW